MAVGNPGRTFIDECVTDVLRGQHVSEDERQRFDFELPNVGHGSERVGASNIVGEDDYLLVVLLGSHYCSRSRELVKALRGRHDAFRRRGTTVVPVLPDIRERARVWDRQYDLPFPMRVDPAEDERRDERARGPSVGGDGGFDAFAPLEGSVADLPAVALCRPSDAGVTVVATESEAALEAPVVDSLLGFVESHRATDATARSGNAPADS